jgi:hypothetical protein
MFTCHHYLAALVNGFEQFDNDAASGRLGDSRFSFSVTLT